MDSSDFIETRTTVYGQLRRASDRVRFEIIPQALAAPPDARAALIAFNRAYFEEDVFAGQMVGDGDRINQESENTDSEFYRTVMSDFEGLRTAVIQVHGLELVHPSFLPMLADRYFELLDRGAKAGSEEAFYRFLMAGDLVHRLTHFPKDGTGRAGEDLRVYLGLRHGFELSSSQSGYRGALDGRARPIFFRNAAQRIGNRELVARAYAYAGLSPPPQFSIRAAHIAAAFERSPGISPHNCWPADLIDPIEATFLDCRAASAPIEFSSSGRRLYIEFIAKETIYALMVLGEADRLHRDLCTRYPLYAALYRIDHDLARKRRYIATPLQVGERSDRLVARIERRKAKPGSQDEAAISAEIDDISVTAPNLANLMREELTYGPTDEALNRLRIDLDGVTGERIRTQIEQQLGLNRTMATRSHKSRA